MMTQLMRGKTNTTEGKKGAAAFVPGTSERLPPENHSVNEKRKSERRKRASKQKRIKGQDGEGPQQLAAGVRKGSAFPPLYACILLSSLLQLSELRCCLEETALASPPPPPFSSSSTPRYPFCADRGFKMQDSTVLKNHSPPPVSLAPVHSDWTACAPQWMHWVGVDQDGWR